MKPIVLLSNVEHQCLTFAWPDDLKTYVGYRFVEHEPKLTPDPLPHRSMDLVQPPPTAPSPLPHAEGWLENWRTEYAEPKDSLHLRFQAYADGSAQTSVIENEGLQERTWRFVPDFNGVWMWMTLTTREAIPGAFVVQQCLRFTSGIGFGFGRTVARVPFLSELLMQALGNANGTMTWVRRQGKWHAFPVPFTRYHTPVGADVHQDSMGQVDSGLIVRESAPRDQAPASYWLSVAPDVTWETWSAGLYWDRTTYVSNRHPADCVHAGVDFGSLRAGESRTVQGRFYWIEGTKEDLLTMWRKEFSESKQHSANIR